MTFIIANVSPAEVNIAETLSTLKFAARAKFIKNNAQINEDTSGSVAVLMEEIRRLKEQLRSGMPLMQQMIVQPNSTPSRDRRSSEMIDEDLQAKSGIAALLFCCSYISYERSEFYAASSLCSKTAANDARGC